MKKVEIGKAVGYGWQKVLKDFWYFVALSAVYLALSSVFSTGAMGGFLGIFVGAWLTAGFTAVALKVYGGGKLPPFETLLTQFEYFWRVLGAQILIVLIIAGGLILLIIPGIYWAIKYQFAVNLIVDKNRDILQAMGESGKLTEGIKLPLFLFDLALIGIMILGGLVFGVGVLVAFPVVWLANIYMYKKLL